MTYLTFVEQQPPEPRKTKIWAVLAVSTGDHLGWIKWRNTWRRYVFVPNVETTFDANCLLEVYQFLNRKMEEREHL